MNEPTAVTARPNRPWLGYLIPTLIPVALTLTYLIAPGFYLKWVLEAFNRENQICEILTVGSAAIAGLILLYVTVRFWLLNRRLLAASQLIIALAAIFFAGEEIDWGQIYFDIETPESYREHYGTVTNLHNADLPIPVRQVGNVFLICVFLVLPGLWRFRPGLLPRDWAPIIPEGPVVYCIILAHAWSAVKKVYRLFVEVGERPDPQLYWEYLEQINEHKELLVAVTLLMYAVYRVGKVNALKAAADET